MGIKPEPGEPDNISLHGSREMWKQLLQEGMGKPAVGRGSLARLSLGLVCAWDQSGVPQQVTLTFQLGVDEAPAHTVPSGGRNLISSL